MKRRTLSLILALVMVFAFAIPASAAEFTVTAAPAKAIQEVTRKSAPGTYEGFYEEADLYQGADVHNVYVDVPAAYKGAFQSDPKAKTTDFIKIALTYVLPANANGVVAKGEKYPAILQCVRYDLSPSTANGRYKEGTDAFFTEHGYVVIRIDLRGMGASGGVAKGFGTRENGLDVAYIIENWLQNQSWYNGKCAMYGSSNQGVIGNTTAVNVPDSMAGYQVGVASVDYYSQKYNNGVSISNNNAGIVPAYSVDTFPSEVLDPASPENPRGIFGEIKPYAEWIKAPTAQFVDDDPEGLVAYEHYKIQQTYNEMFFSYMTVPNMYRDSVDEAGWEVYEDIVLFEEVDQIANSELQTYNYAGYADIASTAQLALATYTDGHIVISNGNHGGAMRGGDFATSDLGFDSQEDFLRYFDWLLKGVDNGFGEAPFAYYYLLDTAGNPNGTAKPGQNPAHYADSIPFDATVKKDFYFDAATTIAAGSPYYLAGAASNNGTLVNTVPAASSVDYRVDTDISFDITGMSNGPIGADSKSFTGAVVSGDLSNTVDSKSITFTTAPLTEKLTYIGNGTMDIWASCANANDFDLIGMLELVRADGTSNYLSRGTLRASHRDPSTGEQNKLWDNIGLSEYMHDSTKAKVEARQKEGIKEPTLLKFNLELNAVTLNKGDCLRVTLFGVTKRSGADTQSYMYYDEAGKLLTGDKLPLITFYTGGEHASKMTLPTYTSVNNTLNGTVTFDDGSYTGPATMYMLEDNYYLQYNGDWKQLDKNTTKINHKVGKDGCADFYNAGFTFQPEGAIIADGQAQLYMGGEEAYDFPALFEGYEGPIVALKQGRYMGAVQSGIYTFKGIQYGKAPMFEAPQKMPSTTSTKVIPALEHGPSSGGVGSADIDCLNLSLYVNPNWDEKANGPRSVFMWVFGSANNGGRVGSPDWTNFVKDNPGIIVVTPTHRGGRYGSMDLSVLEGFNAAKNRDASGQSKYRFSNNLARLDILQVLKWINENIAEFGGNPDDVAIGGQSSGGNLCASVMLMPESKELWDKALLQESFPLDGSLMPKDEAELVSKNVFDTVGVKTIDELLALEPAKLTARVADPSDFGYKALSPVVDDIVIKADYFEQLLGPDGLWAGKPILFGNNEGCYDQMYTPGNDEGNIATARGRSIGNISANGWYAHEVGEKGSEDYIENLADYIVEQYLANYPERSANYAAKDLDYDLNMRIPSILFAEAVSDSTDVYFYQLRFNSKAVIDHIRAGHGSENAVLSKSWVPNARGEDSAEDRAIVAERLSNIWAEFIQNGDPNKADLGGAVWTPYQTGTRDTMILDNEFYMVQGVRNKDTDLILPMTREYSSLVEVKGVPAAFTGEEPDFSGASVGPVGAPYRSSGEIEWTKTGEGEGYVNYRATVKDAIVSVAQDKTGYSRGVVTSDYTQDFTLKLMPYTDVPKDWAFNSIAYVFANDLMAGASETSFNPNAVVDRATLIQALYNAAGKPAVTGTDAFPDVAADADYAKAVIWAKGVGLVKGYPDGNFGPTDALTREQVATTFYRYAEMDGAYMLRANDISSYKDVAEVGNYAYEAMQWANAEHYVMGRTADTLAPTATCIRAELAGLLTRFLDK